MPQRQTHDYYRYGTTMLYAALDVVSGAVIGECNETHKGEDFIAFLKLINRRTPKGNTVHIIADNYSAHKTKQVKEYIASMNGRFVRHFIPTHSTWLNLLERFFAEITSNRIRRGSWTGKKQLEKATMDYIHEWNESKRRFVWAKTSGEIIAKIDKTKAYWAKSLLRDTRMRRSDVSTPPQVCFPHVPPVSRSSESSACGSGPVLPR